MTDPLPGLQGPVCPVPLRHNDQIVIGHGSGGRMTHELVSRVFASRFSNPALDAANDSAALALPRPSLTNGRLAVSTDAHVVFPLFFPGGDIGRLAVSGTVNDVSMSGAQPLYLTASFIIEEGLPVATLERIAESMRQAALEAGVQIVAGDTKVVERGKADQLFITTSGVGWLPEGRQIGGEQAKPGDRVIISGTLGDHGLAVLCARGDLGFEMQVQSDVAPLNHLIAGILSAAPNVHVLRDPTRGGLATTLNEIARQSQVSIWIDEQNIPIHPAVKSACEMLGFDPLYVANEGKVIVIVPEEQAAAALSALQQHPLGENARLIGEVRVAQPGRVMMRTLVGGTRILDMLAGEMLPRIC